MSRDQSIVHRGHSLQQREVRSRHPDAPMAGEGGVEGPGCAMVNGQCCSEDHDHPSSGGGTVVKPGDCSLVTLAGSWPDASGQHHYWERTYFEGAYAGGPYTRVHKPFQYLRNEGSAQTSQVASYPAMETSQESAPACTMDDWFKVYGKRHDEMWYPYVVPAHPAGAIGIMWQPPQLDDTFRHSGNTWGSPGGLESGYQVRVKPSAPSSVRDGNGVSTFFGTSQGVSVPPQFIPINLVPAEGGTIHIGIAPNFDVLPADPHSGPCFTSAGAAATEYDLEAQGGGGSNGIWLPGAPWWVGYDPAGVCPPAADAEFQSWPVGTGDGSNATFVGFPTTEGTEQWYVDGLLTEPDSYDAATGTAVFDRAPAVGAPVSQSGMGR